MDACCHGDIFSNKDMLSLPQQSHKNWFLPWLLWLSELSAHLQTKGSLVQFPIRARAWVVGQVPSRGRVRGNHTLTFLSLSFSLTSPLSKNK